MRIAGNTWQIWRWAGTFLIVSNASHPIQHADEKLETVVQSSSILSVPVWKCHKVFLERTRILLVRSVMAWGVDCKLGLKVKTATLLASLSLPMDSISGFLLPISYARRRFSMSHLQKSEYPSEWSYGWREHLEKRQCAWETKGTYFHTLASSYRSWGILSVPCQFVVAVARVHVLCPPEWVILHLAAFRPRLQLPFKLGADLQAGKTAAACTAVSYQ